MMVTSSVRKQDLEADRIGDDELIVDHGLRGIEQNLSFSEVELEVLVDDDFVAVQEKVDDLRIPIFIEFLKLREPEFIDGFLLERVEIGCVMKSSGDDVLKNCRLLDMISWLSEICLRYWSYIDQITRVVEWSGESRSNPVVRL